jgi:hypothetical protein
MKSNELTSKVLFKKEKKNNDVLYLKKIQLELE